MFDRFERPVKIVCLGLAVLLAWQLCSVILRGDPLANLKIPALPTLPGATNETARPAAKETNATVVKKTGTNAPAGTNGISGTNVDKGTNGIKGTSAVNGTNTMAASTNAVAASDNGQANASAGPRRGGPRRGGPPEGIAGLPPGMTPEMMADMPPEIIAQMMGGGGPGGRRGGPAMKKVELPPEVQARVDKIISSEIFGPIIRPMPMGLMGIADDKALIRATNGQTDWVKVGGEMGGIKLLRTGINRVLVEQGGEKKELTMFDGIGGESLMPKTADVPSTNLPSANGPSTNAPTRRGGRRNAAAANASTNETLSTKQKETQ